MQCRSAVVTRPPSSAGRQLARRKLYLELQQDLLVVAAATISYTELRAAIGQQQSSWDAYANPSHVPSFRTYVPLHLNQVHGFLTDKPIGKYAIIIALLYTMR